MENRNRRNCGSIHGNLQEMEPFFFIARRGAWLREQKARVSEKRKGRFIVGAIAGNGICPMLGVILPLSSCRDENVKSRLLELHQYLAQNADTDDNLGRFMAAQTKLLQYFGGLLKLDEHARLDGYVEMERTKGLFEFLAEHFDYIEELDDDPAGNAKPTVCKPFIWKSYGEFLEWFYSGAMSLNGSWDHLNPFLVFDRTGFLENRWSSHTDVVNVSANFEKYFTIKPEVENQNVSVRLEMGEYGWASLHITIESSSVEIALSNVFPPFETMLEWIKRVSGNDIPSYFDIDEEGHEKRLAVFSTDDPERVLFRVIEPYDNEEVFVEGIVSRLELVTAFRNELLRFFWTEFNPKHWDSNDEKKYPLKQRMLSDSWLSDKCSETVHHDSLEYRMNVYE